MRTVKFKFLITLFGFSSILTSELLSQKDSLSNFSLSSFDIYYGARAFYTNFYSQFNSTSNLNIRLPVKTLGIGTSGHFIVNRGSDFYGHFIYHYVIPENLFVRDTVKGKIAGFIFSFAYGAIVSSEKGNFALYIYSGVNTGRLKITGNESMKQKNPFFAPKIGVQPKFKFGPLAFSLILESDYDLSKTSWKKTLFTKSEQITISKFRQSAINAHVGIGYLF